MKINLTDLAAFRLRTFLRARENQGETASPVGIRLATVDGGCSGYEYSLDITTTPKEDDVVLEEAKVLFYVDRMSAPLLDGMVIDFVEGLTQSGFKFINPNASETCGCGKSFKAGDCAPAGVSCS